MRNDKKDPIKGNLIQEHPDNDNPARFGWLRSRWAIIIGFVLLVTLLVVFGNGNSQASLGQSMSAVRQQKDLSSPQEYQFTGQGELTAGSAEAWVVGGVPVVISDQTQIEGKIHPGDSVSLVGHILEDGSWLAERVVPISERRILF